MEDFPGLRGPSWNYATIVEEQDILLEIVQMLQYATIVVYLDTLPQHVQLNLFVEIAKSLGTLQVSAEMSLYVTCVENLAILLKSACHMSWGYQNQDFAIIAIDQVMYQLIAQMKKHAIIVGNLVILHVIV